jgi:phosphatidylinositol alpha-1,6-mannosyltransferase
MPLWRFFVAALTRSLVVARRFRPHVVLAGSGLAAPFAWLAAKCAGARMGIYVHGLDLIENQPIYRWFWRPFIRRAEICFVNSHNTARLAAAIGVPDSRIAIVHPGVDMPGPEPETKDFRQRFAIGDGPILLSVGRLIERKGLLEFVERSLPAIVMKHPDVRLVVLGDETPDLLHGDSTRLGARIRARADELGVARNLVFIGPQDDAVLAAAYRATAVHVFPVREVEGDVEGFGMVAVEAAAHGVPTVAFAVGGVPDAVHDGVSGCLIAPGDYVQLAEKVGELLRPSAMGATRAKAQAFAERFEWRLFGAALRRHVNGLVAAQSTERHG